MLAAVYYGPNDLRVEERAIPQISPDEALLKVSSVGICGTDLRILHGGHRKYPIGTVRVPGHEVVGEIVEVGASVVGLAVGQRVIVAPNWGCGHCRQCVSGNNNRCANYGAVGITEDGAFAEFMRIPSPAILQGNLIPLENNADSAHAAMIEPLACVLRGQDAVHITANDVVLVMGGGPIGIMHIMLAKLQGARRIILSEIHAERLEKALQVGADRVVNSREEDLATAVMDESWGEGADVIITAVGAHSAQESALQLAAIGGRINFFGGLPKARPTVQFDSNTVHYKEIYVTGTTACSTKDCWRAAAIVRSGRLDMATVVSARFPLAEAVRAFSLAEDRNSLKIVVEP
ncbi:MAG: zinc-binding dehydrogenase [Aggregatilineales bacterium]